MVIANSISGLTILLRTHDKKSLHARFLVVNALNRRFLVMIVFREPLRLSGCETAQLSKIT